MQSDHGKLFIGGISWETNEEGLKEYFSTYGEVIEAVIMKDRTTGRARGFGFVVFSDPTAADRVAMEKHKVDGRMVEAKKAVPRDDHNIISRASESVQSSPGQTRTRKIFVGGLASTVTENSFKKYFEQFGTITDVVVMYDHNTKRPRGFGFITYDSEEAVDSVLIKSFHELNGKMVEVKRAVPKELSPGPTRSPLAGYSYGLSRANQFLNAYSHPGSLGGYEVRMDGRFSPIASSRTGFPPFGSAYGMGINFEHGLNPGFGGNAKFSSNLSFGRGGVNPYFIGNSDGFVNPVGYDGGNGGSTSFFSSGTRKLWGNDGANLKNHGGGNLGNSNVNWGALPGQGEPNANNAYSSSDGSYTLGGGTYERNGGSNAVSTSSAYASSVAGYDGELNEIYGSGAIYRDSTWRSANSEQDGSTEFTYSLGHTTSDVNAKASAGYVCGYSVNKRQPNRGIAT